MNKEVEKAIARANGKESIFTKAREWYRFNGYKVNRVIFFPVWFAILAKDKINRILNGRQKWNEKKANKIFSYYIPRRADWDEETKTFYFNDDRCDWHIHSASRFLKRKDRRFWKLHSSVFSGELRNYLINTFELSGFTKEIINQNNYDTEIRFRMIEE